MSYRTSRNALPSSKKTHSEKHKAILKQLLKEAANKTCVDCKTASHPRWASWNLGCFICIRCSGIHRSMGTHISKVKSVDLDAWTDEQVESMVKWGNEKCNIYWESKLPENYIPDQLKIENFIRTKYDLKKWVLSSNIPDPLSINLSNHNTLSNHINSNSQPNINHTSVPDKTTFKQSNSQPTSTIDLLGGGNSTSKQNGLLLDDDFGSFTSSTTSPPPQKPQPAPPVKNQLPKVPTQNISQGKQSAQSTGGSFNQNNGRQDLKKSILSLYSSPSSSSSSFIQPLASQQQILQVPQPQVPQQVQKPIQPHPQPQPNSQNKNLNSLTNSLSGLNFNTQPSNTVSNNSTQTSLNQLAKSTSLPPAWNNEWADTTPSNSSNQWSNTSTNSGIINSSKLDDDLFKNVWS